MEYLIGVILTVAVAAFAAVIGFDRERAFYPGVEGNPLPIWGDGWERRGVIRELLWRTAL